MKEKPVEIKQVSDREIWVGEHRLYLGEDNMNYITSFGGYMDEKQATEVSQASLRLMNTVQGKVNCLIDLNKVGQQSSGARKIWREWSENEKTGKVALFGLQPVARVIASFVIGVTRKRDIRFFKTREEALAWLKK